MDFAPVSQIGRLSKRTFLARFVKWLAHAAGDKVEAAYRRGDLFEKRRALAEAWAQYCDGDEPTESKIVRLAGRAG
jgi:hypothetical protein